MEAEMKTVFQQKVQEKEQKLKQSEEELYARHREMKEALEKQRLELDDKKRRIESGRPLTPEKGSVSCFFYETRLLWIQELICYCRKNVSVLANNNTLVQARTFFWPRWILRKTLINDLSVSCSSTTFLFDDFLAPLSLYPICGSVL